MMKFLLYASCLIIFLSSCSKGNIKYNSAEKENNRAELDTLPSKIYDFPNDWLGNWSGDLEIYNAQGLKQIVQMSLDLSTTDTAGIYTWAITYGQDSTAQKRDYQLIEVDSSKGHYLIDERNGIFLDAYHIHDELSSIFEVMGNMLLTSYKIEIDELIFSVKVFPSEEVRVSGDTLIGNQEIPQVSSYQLNINQIARLQKKCLVE